MNQCYLDFVALNYLIQYRIMTSLAHNIDMVVFLLGTL